MTRVTTDVDRSRNGFLVHSAKSSGRTLDVVVYIEGTEDPRYEICGHLICRTAEQSAAIARALNEPTDIGELKDAAIAAARAHYAYRAPLSVPSSADDPRHELGRALAALDAAKRRRRVMQKLCWCRTTVECAACHGLIRGGDGTDDPILARLRGVDAAAREVYAQSLASNGRATFEAWAKLGDALDAVDGKGGA